MKYLENELYYVCTFKPYSCLDTDYPLDNFDGFLIGILNKNNTKLKDIITGKIVKSDNCKPLNKLKWNSEEYIADYYKSPSEYSFKRYSLAKKIKSILSSEVLTEKDIIKIKNIINISFVKFCKKTFKANNKKEKIEEKQKIYSISESERDF